MFWKKLSIGKKIAMGFGTTLTLLAVVIVLSYAGVAEIVLNASQVIGGNRLDGNLAQKEVDHLNWVAKVNALLTDENMTSLEVETDDHKCGFGKWLYGQGRKEAEALVPSLAPLLKQIEVPHHYLHQSAKEIEKVFKQANHELPALLAMRESDHLKWASSVRDTLLRGENRLNVQTDPHQCALGKWLHTAEAKHIYENGDGDFKKVWDLMIQKHANLHNSAIDIQKALQISQKDAHTVFETKTLPILASTLKHLQELKAKAELDLRGMKEANLIYSTKTLPALVTVQALLKGIRAEVKKHIMTDEAMLKAALSTKRNVLVVGATTIMLGILLAFFLARGIIHVLRKISSQMDEGAEQVASASGQVSSASQLLAEGASEQAASIEETSSSLEEMAAMTRQNAENSNHANRLMDEAKLIVGEANETMDKMNRSMAEISNSSEETSKIIKTIDEIAFQTNLLALNAAVEAARAGEAGSGFAVVADEVRNLAMRAAEAARDTSTLIENTNQKVIEGSQLVNNTNDEFSKVAGSANKVAELVGEIAEASKEQAQGIDQINKAVNEMDKVTQQNAANAEESASAAEEMNMQAGQMKSSVSDLTKLVGGATNGFKLNQNQKRGNHRTLDSIQPITKNKIISPVSEAKKALPECVIPLDEDEFKDF